MILLLACSLLLFGCASDQSKKSEESVADKHVEITDEMGVMPEESKEDVPDDRKVIKNYNLEFESRNFDENLKSLDELVSQVGGHYENQEEQMGAYRSLWADIRIPSKEVESFIQQLSQSEGIYLRNKSVYADDITEVYRDTELRLKNQQEKLKRLQELKADQPDLKSLLEVENEISETIYEIERMQSSIQNFDKQIEYSLVTIMIRENTRATESGTEQDSFFKKLSTGFRSSFHQALYALEALILFIVSNIVLIIILVILVFVGVRVLSKRKKADPKTKKDSE